MYKRDLMHTGMVVLQAVDEMQSTGMYLSRIYFEELLNELEKEASELVSIIESCYMDNDKFNPKSPVHVRKLLHKLDIPSSAWTSSGLVSTSRKALIHLRESYNAIDLIFSYREVVHLIDSFVKPLLVKLDSSKDIQTVHAQIKPTRTVSRRFASSNPNLLAMPNRGIGSKIRAGFIAPSGYVYVSGDLSQIEVRVLASLSKDPRMIEIYEQDRDIYKETAASRWKIPIDQVTSNQRQASKVAVLGTMYGLGPRGLVDQLRQVGLTHTIKQASEELKGFLTAFSGVNRFIEQTTEIVKMLGYAEDMWGMRRYLPHINHPDRVIQAEAQREAISLLVQGGAQGIIQESLAILMPQLRDLRKESIDVRICLQIHDEIILLCPEEHAEMISIILNDALICMGDRLLVPLKASVNYAKSWDKLK